ncbi:hypothetical protein LguiA_035039 [Lonicera macranthoides]
MGSDEGVCAGLLEEFTFTEINLLPGYSYQKTSLIFLLKVADEMNANDSSTKGLAEMNPHMWEHQKESRDRVGDGDGQGILQQQPQGPVVQWERFLPLRSLKVLVVENNDSTRHVITALLQNCGYEVVALTNGLEARKILEDATNHIDLLLTEVVTPCLPGVSLLSKIKRHKVSKHIPVIMMSSNDSMGTVIKCLSKGAVDFLVKPIRKNELKNLWQHVWRKCRSYSGSGSESDIRTENLMKSEGVEGLENNDSSNNENDNDSFGLNFKDETDNGSGTQSSWSKRIGEVDRHQHMSMSDQLADPHDGTRVQVIHSRPEAISSNWVPKSATKECCGEDELDCVGMGQDLEIGIQRSLHLRLEDANEVPNRKTVLDSEPMNGKQRNKAANFTLENVTNEVSNDPSKIIYVTAELSSLELRLKRERVEGDSTTGTQERSVLRCSDLSAFTRYKDDMGSRSDYVFTKPEAVNDVPIAVSTVTADRRDTTAFNTVSAQAKPMHHRVQVQQLHHYYHHHHHHHMPKQQERDLSNCRPSNVLTLPIEGKAANYMSYNLSGSGSINRSNGENGSSSNAAMPKAVNPVSHFGGGGNCGSDDGSGGRSMGSDGQNRLTWREAALYKFRQKKRDRCFDKKTETFLPPKLQNSICGSNICPSRCDIKTGRDWLSRDRVFVDNLCD